MSAHNAKIAIASTNLLLMIPPWSRPKLFKNGRRCKTGAKHSTGVFRDSAEAKAHVDEEETRGGGRFENRSRRARGLRFYFSILLRRSSRFRRTQQIDEQAIGSGHAGRKLAEERQARVDVDAFVIARIDE